MAKKAKKKTRKPYTRRPDAVNPPGRPSEYKPEFCERVIEMGREGMSQAQIASELGVHRATIRNTWVKDHPEFKEAWDLSLQLAQSYWEEKFNRVAKRGTVGDGQGAALTFLLSRRFRGDYQDKVSLEHTGPDGGPIETASLTHEQLIERAKERGLPTKIFED